MTVTTERPQVEAPAPVEAPPTGWASRLPDSPLIATCWMVLAVLAVVGLVKVGARVLDGTPTVDDSPVVARTVRLPVHTFPADPQPREVTYPGYRLPSPAPSAETFRLATPQGTTPIFEASAGVPVTWDATDPHASRGACTWTPTVGHLTATEQAHLLVTYNIPASAVVEWNLLIPTYLTGSPTDARNVWPMTSATDVAGKRHLEQLVADALCNRTLLADGPIDAPRAHTMIREYWHWWGPLTDPKAGAR